MGYKHNKEEIIQKGSELIRKKGYHNVGVNEILKTNQIPKGSFYNFFDSKEAFAVDMIDMYAGYSLKKIQSFLRNEDLSPLNRLKTFYGHLIDSNETDGCDAGCLVNNMSVEIGGQVDALAQVADKAFMTWVEEIAICVQAGQEQGEIIKTMEAIDIAEYLHASIYGAFSRMKVNRDSRFLRTWYDMTFAFISE